MFLIKPVQSIEELKKYAEICGRKAREGFLAYSMKDVDTDELMGFAQFDLRSDCGYITDLVPSPAFINDFEAMFILGRQTMNFINLCGVEEAYATADAADEKLLRAIGFKPEGDEYRCTLTGMFDSNCGNH